MNLHLRPASKDDRKRILAIERTCFEDSPWRSQDFDMDECMVAEVDGQIAGFLVSRQIFPAATGNPAEREILNLAVAPGYRRRGIAEALLKQELSYKAREFLEVRESNTAARKLYAKFGFVEVGRRPEYYQSPVETAIVMRMK